jgi:hypothetical protein
MLSDSCLVLKRTRVILTSIAKKPSTTKRAVTCVALSSIQYNFAVQVTLKKPELLPPLYMADASNATEKPPPMILSIQGECAVNMGGAEFFKCIAANDPARLDAYRGSIHDIHAYNHVACNGVTVAAFCRLSRSLQWCILHGVGRRLKNIEGGLELFSALHAACISDPSMGPEYDNPECARLLVEIGANPTVLATHPEAKLAGKEWNGTPLHFAVATGNVNITRYLASLAWDFPGLLDIRNNHDEDALDAVITFQKDNGIRLILEGVKVRMPVAPLRIVTSTNHITDAVA